MMAEIFFWNEWDDFIIVDDEEWDLMDNERGDENETN